MFAQKIDLNKQKNQNHNTESISKYINKKNAQLSSVPQDNLKYNGVSKSQARLAFVIDDINRSYSGIYDNDFSNLFPDMFLTKKISLFDFGSDLQHPSNSIGGGIFIKTIDIKDILKPSESIGGKFKLGFDSNNSNFSRGIVTGVQNDRTSFLVGGIEAVSSDIYTGNNQRFPNSAKSVSQFISELNYKISDNQNIKLKYLFFKNNSEQLIFATSPLIPMNFLNSDVNNKLLSLSYDYNPENNKYINTNFKLFQQNDSEDLSSTFGIQKRSNTSFLKNGFKLSNKSLFQNDSLLYGVKYYHAHENGYNEQSPEISFSQLSYRDNYGAFIENNYAFNHSLSLLLGISYNQIITKSSNKNTNHFLNKKITINYSFSSQWKSFITYSESFRQPSLTELFMQGNLYFHPYYIEGNNQLNPEKSKSEILGLIFSSNIGAAKINISNSIFYNDIKNYLDILYHSISSNNMIIGRTNNIPKAEIYGYKLGVSIQTPMIIFMTHFTLNQGKYKSNYNDNMGNIIKKGDFIPMNLGYGNLSLTFPIRTISSKLSLITNFGLKQSHTNPHSRMTSIPGYSYYGINIGINPYHDKNILVNLGVNNITDKRYFVSNGIMIMPQMGRNYFINTNIKF